MSWLAVLALGGGAYLFKVLGLVVVGGRPLPRPTARPAWP